MLCVCVSIGAWAEQVSFGSEGSWYEIDGSTLTIHVAENHDLGNNYSYVVNSLGDAKNGITKIVYDKNSNMSGSDAVNSFVNQFTSVETIDLSGVTLQGANDSYYFGSYTNVKSLILADVTADKTIEIAGNSALQAVLVTPKSQTTVKFSGNNSENAGIIINENVTKDGNFAYKWIGEISSFTTIHQDFSANAADLVAKRLVVTGTMSSEDTQYVSILSNLSEDIRLLDMSGVTLQNIAGTNVFPFGTNPHLYSVVLPKDLEDVQAWWFEGCTNLYAAVSYNTAKTRLCAYVNQPGRMKNTLLDINKGSSNTIGNAWQYEGLAGPGLSNSFKSVKLSGTLNALDISTDDYLKLNTNGSLDYSSESKEEITDSRTLNGNRLCAPFNGIASTIEELDLSDAYFPVYTDMTLSAVGYANSNLKKVMLPTDSRQNIIPAFMFSGQFQNLFEICIPSNYEVIKTCAFAKSAQGFAHIWTTDPDPLVTVDNGVTANNGTFYEGYAATDAGAIGQYNMPKWGTYTFSANLKLIESYAFASQTVSIKDVYVLARQAPECHVDAFNVYMYIGQSGFAGSPADGIVTRDAYKNGNVYITMLHYPRDCDAPEIQRYTDMGREYSIATGEVDGKGANIYFPSYSEFLRAYMQGTYGYLWNSMDDQRAYGELVYNPSNDNAAWSAAKQKDVNDYVAAHKGKYASGTKAFEDAVFYDVTLGSSSVTNTKPAGLKDYWTVAYGGTNLYPQAEALAANAASGAAVTGEDGNNDGKTTSRDFRGWHQFVLTGFAANTELIVTQHRSYLSDNDWWTICLPYDLTYSEMMFFYGTTTTNADGKLTMDETKIPYLSQLVNVVRDLKAGKITLNFSKNLMNHSQVKNAAGDWEIGDAEDTSIKSDDKVVLHAGVPYMIRPYRTAVDGQLITQFDVYGDNGPSITIDNAFSNGRKAMKSESLYTKLKTAESLTGSAQRALMENGLVTVPALVANRIATDATYEENVKDDSNVSYTYNSKTITYPVSSEFDYTFVGSFYKAFIPVYSYYLGYKNGACFFYADQAKDIVGYAKNADGSDDTSKPLYPYIYNEMFWNNNTSLIVPNMLKSSVSKTYNLGKGTHDGTVTQASGTGSSMKPAQWVITGTSDDLRAKSGAHSKSYDMVFGIAQDGLDDEIGVTTDIQNVDVMSVTDNKIYTLDGRSVDSPMESLPKGIYIHNGKKVVVK